MGIRMDLHDHAQETSILLDWEFQPPMLIYQAEDTVFHLHKPFFDLFLATHSFKCKIKFYGKKVADMTIRNLSEIQHLSS